MQLERAIVGSVQRLLRCTNHRSPSVSEYAFSRQIHTQYPIKSCLKHRQSTNRGISSPLREFNSRGNSSWAVTDKDSVIGSDDNVLTEDAKPENNYPSVSPETVFNRIIDGLQEAGHVVLPPSPDNPEPHGPIGVIMSYPEMPADTVVRVFVAKPKLILSSPGQWRDKMEMLVNEGVYPNRAFRILSTLPEILEMDPDLIIKKLLAFRQAGMHSETIPKAIARRPELLTEVTPARVFTIGSNLTSFFSSEQATSLISGNPEILFQNFDDIEEKYEYMYFEMGCDAASIKNAKKWITKPISFIQMRHEFLVRTGAYKMPEKKRPLLTKDNPKLWNILDSSANYFARQVAGVTLREYQVFEDLFERQLRLNDREGYVQDFMKNNSGNLEEMEMSDDEDQEPGTAPTRRQQSHLKSSRNTEETQDYDEEGDVEFITPTQDNEFARNRLRPFKKSKKRYDYKQKMLK